MNSKGVRAGPGSRAGLLLGLGAFVLLLALFALGREVLIRGTLARAGAAARRLGEASRDSIPRQAVPFGASDALLWLLEPEALDAQPPAPVPEASDSKGKAPSARRLGPTPQPVVTLQTDVVLRLAERGAMPRGVVRDAAGDLPAGIEILDGGALGIGWFPGDRLIQVDGVSVLDRTEVVRQVLERRARREPVITATLVRRTQSGVSTFRVLVAQPYLAPAEADAGSSKPEAAGSGPASP